ncbi:MAG: hypothetical protein GY705_26935, partial [Bacteroidetes bacterium]|nr:hypothetical protein [Bacteroidota bacterium]
DDIEKLFNLPILVEIASMKKSDSNAWDKLKALALIASSLYIVTVIGIFGALELHGIERSINLIKSYINF